MRIGAAIALLVAMVFATSCSSGLFRQYEYEEDIYLALDGSATVYVNASLAALNALRGTSFDESPSADVDRDAVRAFYTAPGLEVTSVTQSRRSGRRFAHVRLSVDPITHLASAAPFTWSTYSFEQQGELFVYRQTLGASAGKAVGDVGWTGDEIAAFRLHLPSRIVYHNAGPGNPKRGNILVWEQPLATRLRGEPLVLDARMESQSILYTTLYLFGATALLVALVFAVILWWVVKYAGRAVSKM
ncbi:MAG: hypothetical protein LBQ09_09620 [Acidobacteriaceae bacterium]|jgi:hypothetical protein|nr:hypothetical protein [Acidobacteriaceae bacterium]